MPLRDLLKARKSFDLFRVVTKHPTTCQNALCKLVSASILSEDILLTLSGFQSALTSIPNGTWKILITDDHAQTLLDTVYKPGEILQQNVTCESSHPDRI
jgi:hypothetical protein